MKILAKLGIQFLRKYRYEILNDTGILQALNRWTHSECQSQVTTFVMRNLSFSKSQIQQDLWALNLFMNKHNNDGLNGYFVEFGATDGVLRSNSYLLEKTYGWSGILCEPARVFHDKLSLNRSAAIDFRCVFSETGKIVKFHEVESLELSGLRDYKHIGGWEEQRQLFTEYEVESISLNDLLRHHGAPQTINYMSIDTEGSEYEILRTFPFEKWNIECFSIEHNFSENEALLDHLLASHGYRRVLKQVSGFDGWYVKE